MLKFHSSTTSFSHSLSALVLPFLHRTRKSLCLSFFRSQTTVILSYDPTELSLSVKTDHLKLAFPILLLVLCTVIPATETYTVNKAFLLHY